VVSNLSQIALSAIHLQVAQVGLVKKAKMTGVAALGLMVALMAALWQEIPRWRVAGTRSVAAPSVAYGRQLLSCPTTKPTIAILGDSHVAGVTAAGVPPDSFGNVIAASLGRPAVVSLYANGGHTAEMGEKAWVSQAIDADILLLMYGTNDAAPRGWLRAKRAVPLQTFKSSLARQITHWRTRNIAVILVAPPPGGSAAIQARLAPYRNAVQKLGQAYSVPVIDPADAFAIDPSVQPVLTHDALHMNANGQKALGQWVAKQLCG
jgi:lysophospholipase L1-like esterase